MQIAGPPFRWDLVTPDQLGSLAAAREPVRFPYPQDLIVAAGKVVARSGGGDLFFVGRSPDSLFDLLGGALEGTGHARRLHRLAFSGRRPMSPAEVRAAREILGAHGVAPQALARSHRPVAMIDLVSEGGTFTNLYGVLRDWIEAEREPWNVIRRKLRFVGLTERRASSPNAYRWQQDLEWPATLPARSVGSVSIEPELWRYLGDQQIKLTRSFGPERWTAEEPDGPQHDERTRAALGEAIGLVCLGREKSCRSLLVRTMAAEPAYAESWLRTLVRELG
jgi:hypothetical protein